MDNTDNDSKEDNRQHLPLPQPQITNPVSQQPQPSKVPSIFAASIVFSAISFAAWCIVGIFTVQLILACQSGGCSGLPLLLPILVAICTELPALILLIAAGVQLFRHKTSPVFPTARKHFLISLFLFLVPVVLLCLAILPGFIR